jgi:hypothetical protein
MRVILSARDDIDLLSSCCNFMLPKISEAEEEVFRILETSGSTVYVNSLRAFRLHRAVIAVGMFSMYESALQTEFGWENGPFTQLQNKLIAIGRPELAARFRRYRLAINVLKHGEGNSWVELRREDRGSLEFRIKSPNGLFEDEGDVSEGQHFIDADDEFVRGCADLIELTLHLVRDENP